MKKRFSIGLLPRVLIAIVLGILLGLVANEPFVRLFVTFNDLFAQLLGVFLLYWGSRWLPFLSSPRC